MSPARSNSTTSGVVLVEKHCGSSHAFRRLSVRFLNASGFGSTSNPDQSYLLCPCPEHQRKAFSKPVSDTWHDWPQLEEEAVGELDAVVGPGLDVESVPEVLGALQHSLNKFCLRENDINFFILWQIYCQYKNYNQGLSDAQPTNVQICQKKVVW